LKPMYWVFHYC